MRTANCNRNNLNEKIKMCPQEIGNRFRPNIKMAKLRFEKSSALWLKACWIPQMSFIFHFIAPLPHTPLPDGRRQPNYDPGRILDASRAHPDPSLFPFPGIY